MRTRVRTTLRLTAIGLAVALVAACATGRAVRRGQDAARSGDWDAAVAYYRQALGRDPGRIDVKIALERAMREAATLHLARARSLEAQEQLAGAVAEYRLAAELEPSNTLALTKALELERRIRDQIEASRPKPRIEELQQQAAQAATIRQLDPRTRVPALNFPNAAIRDILRAIGDLTGINITYDQGLEGQLGRSYTLNVTDVPLEQVLNQVLQANTLTFKVQDEKTIFVYADNTTNRQKYEDQYQQTFYLSHGDVQEITQIINQLLTTGPAVRPIITQNKSANAIVVRATAPVMGVIKNIIDANDKPRAEVLIDVEILEVSRIFVKEIGLDLSQYALGFTFSPELAPPNTASTPQAFPGQPPPFNLNTLSRGVSPADYYATVPSALVRLLEQDTRTKLLAKPQLRGREGATLTLNLGDEIPIVQTSFLPVAAGGVPTQPQLQYQYRPIGVNLQITPRVTYQDEIILDPITVDKSGLGPTIDVAGQALQTFVSRKAQVSMRLRDGESNLLAGLIREEDRETIKGLPGIARLPILRHLFGNTDASREETDVVIIVTPHIIRSREITAEDLKPLYIGTGQNFGAGSVPTLISPGAAPPPPTVPTGQPGQAGAVPPAQTTGQPPAGATPPAGAGAAGAAGGAGTTRAPGVVPIQPVPSGGAPAPTAPAQIILTAPGNELQLGGAPYTVPVRITDVSQLGSVTLTITFDPAVLRATTVSPGTFMQQGGASPAFAPKIDAAAGRIDIAISRDSKLPGAAGTGLLAAIAFQTVGAGTSRISITGVAMTPAGQPIPVQTVPATVTVK